MSTQTINANATATDSKVVFTISTYQETIYGSQDGWGGFRTGMVCHDGNGNKGYIHFYDAGDKIPSPGINKDANGNYYGTFSTTGVMLPSIIAMLNSGNPVTYYLDLDQGTDGQAYVGISNVSV